MQVQYHFKHIQHFTRDKKSCHTHQKGDSSILCVIEDVLMGTIFGIGLMAGSFGIGLGCWVRVQGKL